MRQLNNHLKYGNKRDGSSRQQREWAKDMQQGDGHGAGRKGWRDMSGEQTNSKGTQAGNGDACDSDYSRAKASQVGDGAGDGYGHVL